MNQRLVIISDGIGRNIDLIGGKLYYDNRPITKLIIGIGIPLEIYFENEYIKFSKPVTAIYTNAMLK